MFGIQNLKEILVFVGKFMTTTGNVTADKKVSIFELAQYLQLWPVIAPAVDGFEDAFKKELPDLTAAEREELKATFAEATDLPRQEVEEVFEQALNTSVEIVELIYKIRAARVRAAA